jgi:hypothetical protein
VPSFSNVACSLPLLLLLLLLLSSGAAANDFPTQARVEFVLGC